MREISGQTRAQLWLACALSPGAARLCALKKRYPDPREALEAARRGQVGAFSGLSEKSVQRLLESASDEQIDALIERMNRTCMDFFFPEDEGYPRLLREIDSPPGVLFVRGRFEPDPSLAIAVIGSRKPTQYGKDAARRFGSALSAAGAIVVSGMASGVDAYASRGALSCQSAACPTIAVLGTGADVIYPSSNEALYHEIIERGAVVSEFAPGTRANRVNFPIRNRIMSGMSHGTLVIEAAERSGTSITVGFALDQGRDVFALPGRIIDPMSAGPNRMIARGEAKAVLSVEDVLSEYEDFGARAHARDAEKTVSFSSLGESERRVCKALLGGELSFDELADATLLPPGALNSTLTALQFSGIMKQQPGRIYALNLSETVFIED